MQLDGPELIVPARAQSSLVVSRIWANVDRLTKEAGWKPHYDAASGEFNKRSNGAGVQRGLERATPSERRTNIAHHGSPGVTAI